MRFNKIRTQTKGILNVVTTILIAISVAFLNYSRLWWWLIIICGLIQILLWLIPSIEEDYYNKEWCSMKRERERKRKRDQQMETFQWTKGFKDLQEKAKKPQPKCITSVSIHDMKKYIEELKK